MHGSLGLFGLIGVGLLSGHAASVELDSTLYWEIQHSIGTNSVAHAGGRAYVASGTTLHVLDLGLKLSVGEVTIDAERFGAITGVAAHGNLVAVAATERASKTAPGSVLIYRYPGLDLQQVITVGVGPDMITFSPLGNKLLVANEGEPECREGSDGDNLIDPEGSISVMDVDNGFAHNVHTVDFAAFNGQDLEGVRIFGPGATVAQDLEPEHIAVGSFGLRAWVTLQENNAIALLDLLHNPPRVASIIPLGDKDYGAAANALDVNDKDGANRRARPHLFGMYQPDGIEAGIIDGTTYLFTANEGDARDYSPCFIEEQRVGGDSSAEPPIPALSLDPASPLAAQATTLKRLRVTTTRGNSGGPYDKLYGFGGRSFAVWDSGGRLLYDSGSTLEDRLAEIRGYFYDSRSDDKGPEPEDLAFGRVDGYPFLFVGLERANGVMVFDVSHPESPSFAAFIGNPRGVGFDDEGEFPERLDFMPAPQSPTGKALLLVTNEESGNTRVFELTATQ